MREKVSILVVQFVVVKVVLGYRFVHCSEQLLEEVCQRDVWSAICPNFDIPRQAWVIDPHVLGSWASDGMIHIIRERRTAQFSEHECEGFAA